MTIIGSGTGSGGRSLTHSLLRPGVTPTPGLFKGLSEVRPIFYTAKIVSSPTARGYELARRVADGLLKTAEVGMKAVPVPTTPTATVVGEAVDHIVKKEVEKGQKPPEER